MKEVNKLAVGSDGLLVETGVKSVTVDDVNELLSVNYMPCEGEIVLQQLPLLDSKTSSGIIIPGYIKAKNEFKCAVIVATPASPYQRGQVVRLNPEFFAAKNQATGEIRYNIPTEYIDGKLVLQVPLHFIRGTYTAENLIDWK